MPSWQSTSRIGCPIDNPARRSRGAAPSTRPQWTRVPLDFRPRWRYVVNKAGAANAAPALKYKFYFTPHFCGYTEFGIVPDSRQGCRLRSERHAVTQGRIRRQVLTGLQDHYRGQRLGVLCVQSGRELGLCSLLCASLHLVGTSPKRTSQRAVSNLRSEGRVH